MFWLIARIRQTTRRFILRPFFSFSIIALFALAIGTSVTLFGVLDAVVFEATPFPESQRLFGINCQVVPSAFTGPCSIPDAVSLGDRSRAFDELAYYHKAIGLLAIGDARTTLVVEDVSSSFFSTLGAWPDIGRWFITSDNRSRDNSLIVLSYKTWQDLFGARVDVVGTSVRFREKSYLVCGIMPREFSFPDTEVQAWVLDPLTLNQMEETGIRQSNVIARLKRGIELPQLRSDLTTVAADLAKEERHDAGLTFTAAPIKEVVLGKSERVVWLSFAATSAFLLLVIANLVTLLTAKLMAEGENHSIRLVLGATRKRLLTEYLAEQALLSPLACLLSLLIAFGGLRFLRGVGGAGLPRWELGGIGIREWLFAAFLSVFACVLSGLLSFSPLSSWIRRVPGQASALFSTRRPRWRLFRTASVVSQLALATVLLISAVSCSEMLWRTLHPGWGFDPQELLSIAFVPQPNDASPNLSNSFFEPLLADLRSLPAVEGAAAASASPLGVGLSSLPVFALESYGRWRRGPQSEVRAVDATYFEVLRMPVLRGRPFNEMDGKSAPCVAIVDHSLARLLFGNDDVLGKRVSLSGRSDDPSCSLVGVVADVRDVRGNLPPAPEIYFSYLQSNGFSGNRAIVVRTRRTAQVMTALRELIKKRDSTRAIMFAATVPEIVWIQTRHERLLSEAILLLAIAAFLVSLTGVLAIVSYFIEERKLDCGIRLALGAQWAELARSIVLRQFGGTVGCGIAAGILLTYALERTLRAWISDLPALALSTCILGAAILGTVAITACFYPMLRFRTLDITRLLRHEQPRGTHLG